MGYNTNMDKAEFFAYLPPIQTALTISGDGDLMQAKFNINLQNSPDATKLLLMTGKKLKVTVETCTELNVETEKKAKRVSNKTDSRRVTDRRNQQTSG